MSEFLLRLSNAVGVDLSESVDRRLEDLELDSFQMMELVSAIDELGVVLDDDVLDTASTVGELYEEYVRMVIDAQE